MNNRYLFLIFILISLSCFLKAQNPWASSVVEYHFGNGQTLGQSSPDFPSNVLGPVNPAVSNTVPASAPSEVLSLGRNGWIVLSFEQDIVNGAGADFTVFENAFEYAEGLIFDEWLMVSVSMDGINWYAFPCDSVTGEGMAGRTPTNGGGSTNYQDITQSGGDGFNLDDVGLPSARYVKLQDATRLQTPEKIAAEVDAVVAIHTGNTLVSMPQNLPFFWQATPEFFSLTTQEVIKLELTDMGGRSLFSTVVYPGRAVSFPLSGITPGIYCLKAMGQNNFYSCKWNYYR